jgi:hypothetical protein
MIKPEQIPDEVWAAAAIRLEALGSAVAGYTARDVIAAALNAWPRSSQLAENDSASIREMAALILPLPQENRKDDV